MTNGIFLGGVAQGLQTGAAGARAEDTLDLQQRQQQFKEDQTLEIRQQKAIQNTIELATEIAQAGGDPAKSSAVLRELAGELSELGASENIVRGVMNMPVKPPKAGKQPKIIMVETKDGKRPFIQDGETLKPVDVPGQEIDSEASVAIPETANRGDIDIEAATGARGFLGGAVNTITDVIAGRLAIKDQAEASTALNALNVETSTTLQDAVPGRPSNFLLEQFQRIAVTPNSLLQGPAGARKKFKEIHDLIQRGILAIDQSMATGKLTKAAVSKATVKRAGLENLLTQYQQLIEAQPSSGLPNVPIESFIIPGG